MDSRDDKSSRKAMKGIMPFSARLKFAEAGLAAKRREIERKRAEREAQHAEQLAAKKKRARSKKKKAA